MLVPFPYATHDHQTENARVLAGNGAALLMAEKDMQTQDAMGQILALLDDTQRLQTMSRCAQAQGKARAAEAVADAIDAVIGK